MKLVKLSLVAALAAGALSTTAFAAPMDEVIKDIDVSGYTRLRYTSDSYDDWEGKTNRNSSKWNFKGVLNFQAKIDDNFFSVISLRYQDSDDAQSRSGFKVGTNDSNDGEIELYQALFGFNYYGTTVTVGRQVLGTFFTDDMVGDGIKILNTDIEGLTLAALWMDSLQEDDEDASAILVANSFQNNKRVVDHNLYGAAIIGSYDPVSFQLWYAYLEDVTSLFAVELAGNFDITDDFSLGLKGQFALSSMDSDWEKIDVTDSTFWGIEASTKVSWFDFSAGYLNYEADHDTDLGLVSLEDQGSFLDPGEELNDYTLFKGENWFWYVTAGVTIPDTGVRIGVDYVDGERTLKGKDYDASEIVGRVEYAHSKKLKFKTWYSHVEDEIYGKDAEHDRFRFEAKYSF